MFGGKKIRSLEARLDRLEEELTTTRMAVRTEMEQALARVEADPNKRLALLVEGIEAALGERVAALKPRIDEAEKLLERAEGVLAPARFAPELDVEIEAEQTGLLTLWFEGGWNDIIQVVVDGNDVARVNTINDLCSSLAMVIRRGERYRLVSQSYARRGKTGWKTMFTPLAP